MWVPSLGGEEPLEEGMATHSSTLAGIIPWTEEPGGLQSLGSQRQTRLSAHTRARLPAWLPLLLTRPWFCPGVSCLASTGFPQARAP